MAEIKKQIEGRENWTVAEISGSNMLGASFYDLRLAFQLEIICKADDAADSFSSMSGIGSISGKIVVYQMVCSNPALWNYLNPHKKLLTFWQVAKG